MILMYHKIFIESPTVWWVDVDNFYRQMYQIRNMDIVYLDDYDLNNENHIVITFDGIYKNVLEFAAPILKKFEYPFELFITSKYLGRNNEFDVNEPNAKFANVTELKELVGLGGRLQWHTKTHPDLAKINNLGAFRNELTVPQDLMEIDSQGFNWFAYPHGRINPEFLEEVQYKFTGAVLCDNGNNKDYYNLKRITVTNQSGFKSNSVVVIIASYNYGAFLVEAIESVLRQTIPPDEILISDDNSNDSTEEIATYYRDKYPDLIKYNRNDQNLGIVKHFNKAVSLTSSDYIMFLGADNRIPSNYIEETKRVLDSSEKIGIVYTDFALFDTRAKIVYDQYPKSQRGDIVDNFYIVTFPEWGHNSFEKLKERNFIHGSSMYKRKAYENVGGYKENTKEAEDHNIFLRIIDSGWLADKAPKTMLEYRQHSIEQANIRRATQSELTFYKNKCKELESERRRISSLIIYKSLKPLMFVEKAISIFKQEGIMTGLIRSAKYIKRKIEGQ